MNRWLCCWLVLPSLPALACNVSQQLEGGADSDAGATQPGVQPDGGAPAPSGQSEAGLSVPQSDAASDPDAAVATPCPPHALQGSSKVLLAAGPGNDIISVDDVLIGANDVYALSRPFALIGVPFAGGAPSYYSPSEPVGALVAGTIVPAGSPVAFENATVISGPLSSGDGVFLGVFGPSAYQLGGPPQGQIVVDGPDAFYWTQTASSLFQAPLAGGPQLTLASYPAPSTTTVTAMATDSSYVYFVTSDTVLHRVAKGGAAVEDLTTLDAPVDGIIVAGSTLYLTEETMEAGDDFVILSYVAGQSSYDIALDILNEVRTSPVAFDGSFFYFGGAMQGKGSGSTECAFELLRVPVQAIDYMDIDPTPNPTQVLVENIPQPISIGLHAGGAYVGTISNLAAPQGAPGQLVGWTP